MINNHKLKNSYLFIQDSNLKKKFSNFKNNLFTQSEFVLAKKVNISKKLSSFKININRYSYKIHTYNDFMVKNILTILMVYNKILRCYPSKLNKSIFPPGRSEIIYNKKNKVIIVDYAHSKDAYINLLSNYNLQNNKLIIVYGCEVIEIDLSVQKLRKLYQNILTYKLLLMITQEKKILII